MVYGYVRVSTREQNEDRQLIAFERCGRKIDKVIIDKQSGKDFKRTGYQKMLKKLKKGDVLIVKSIDRLGRNYNEIIEQWRVITKIKCADIVVLDMPILDTTQNKDLLGTLISDLVLQLLSYVAENERINIKQRQAEGIAAAKARGVKFGRPVMPLPDNFYSMYIKWINKEIPLDKAAKECGMRRATFYNKAVKYRENVYV